MNARAAVTAFGFALALAALEGCPPPTSCSNVVGPSTLEIGAGDPNSPATYRALHDGDTTTLAGGSQGGQHIWVQLRGTGLCGARPRVRMRVVRASDDHSVGVSIVSGAAWSSMGTNGAILSAPLRAIIEPDEYCALVNGGAVRIEANVDDTEGRIVDAAVNVVLNGWSPDTLETDRASREACCANYTNPVCWPIGPPDAGSDAAVGDAVADAGE